MELETSVEQVELVNLEELVKLTRLIARVITASAFALNMKQKIGSV